MQENEESAYHDGGSGRLVLTSSPTLPNVWTLGLLTYLKYKGQTHHLPSTAHDSKVHRTPVSFPTWSGNGTDRTRDCVDCANGGAN